jgi:hypothetical protein
MGKCQTRRFTEEYSGCMELNPTCTYAEKSGFSYNCTHPNHLNFSVCNDAYRDGYEIIKLYDELRETRREQFHAKLGTSLDEYYSYTMNIVTVNLLKSDQLNPACIDLHPPTPIVVPSADNINNCR